VNNVSREQINCGFVFHFSESSVPNVLSVSDLYSPQIGYVVHEITCTISRVLPVTHVKDSYRRGRSLRCTWTKCYVNPITWTC